jgi:pentose-5-phosphate-3-epimerase
MNKMGVEMKQCKKIENRVRFVKKLTDRIEADGEIDRETAGKIAVDAMSVMPKKDKIFYGL